MELTKRLLLWLCFSAALPLIPLLWRPLTGAGPWREGIAQGQLHLIAAGIISGAVGYGAMADADGWNGLLKVFVIGPGLLALVAATGLYRGVSGGSVPKGPALAEAVRLSYQMYGGAIVLGLCSTYLTHQSDRARWQRGAS